MLNLNNIMIGTSNPKSLAEFYEKVFDKPPDWSDGGWFGWQIGNTQLTIGEHSEVKGKAKEPQRLILNFETDKVKEEFGRIKAAGAEVIKEPYGFTDEGKETSAEESKMLIATFSDPDGNYFQLMSPWDIEKN